MDSSPSPSKPPSVSNRLNMDLQLPVTTTTTTTTEDPSSWDWNELLDFSVDFPLSIDSDQNESPSIFPQPPPENPVTDKVRKRDPRLSCSNFLAGIVPCACPELDELMAQEAEAEAEARDERPGGTGKKRARVSRAGPGITARCQVQGCESDISELKGYHKRHRVCLRCANATSVLLDGETKRYCQQCGKFHLLPDFDEGKRSCRRKLERHNRRRRKLIESRGVVDKEQQVDLQTEDTTCDGEAGKDTLGISSQVVDEEAFFESEDGHVSDIHLASEPQNINTDSGASLMASGETQMDGGKNDSKYSPSYCDNKSAYSSTCPTGRISFKLYDWNPAEFPRRLRHQIFEWLANMPVELEGYIRPGCTILTMFIAMPTLMWEKLFESPVSYVEDFVVPPGRMLSGRGCTIIYLNDLILRVMEGGTSFIKVSVKVRAPRLHYIYPTCFEAGKPMEFLACGSNLLQPKFRFLVSFAGKYLASEYRVTSPRGRIEGDSASFDHQLYEIYIPHTEPNFFGPAFVEVENESGLSNFIPVLIGDKEICSEIKTIQQRFDASLFLERSQFAASGSLPDSCEVATSRQTAFSELLLDIAWLLKDPASEDFQQIMVSSQIQRFNRLLNFLIHNESIIILEKLLANMKIIMDKMGSNNVLNGTSEADMRLLQKYMDKAREILHQKFQKSGDSSLRFEYTEPKENCGSRSCSRSDVPSVVPIPNQDAEMRANGKLGMVAGPTFIDRSETVPLLNKEVVMNINPMKEWPIKSCGRVFPGTILSSRPAIFVIATAAVCFAICVVLLHPQKVGKFAVSIRRCLSDKV